ncbi:signal peptidase complex subunit 1-like [Anneissia japonica]|uniref:signal peptidase complex subunit 1-like n=1 Tax=Anneissia japonica TaxID=1529436 RepID=UPI00142593F8|nr:signal peptidase complex subunit 1-like [Anneissia japonica]
MDFLKSIPSHMDFKGQQLAEQVFQAIIILFAVVGFIWGYLVQQFVQTVYMVGAGFILSCILTLPPWPMFRRNPLPWQKKKEESDEKKDGAKEKRVTKKKEKSK